MSKSLQLDIITPQQTLYSGNVTSFTATGVEGSFQILFNHTPFLSALATGPMKFLSEDDQINKYAVTGGFAHVLENKITVLVESAEKAENIDVARAHAAKERAEARLKLNDETIDVARARAALIRAVNRLRVSGAM